MRTRADVEEMVAGLVAIARLTKTRSGAIRRGPLTIYWRPAAPGRAFRLVGSASSSAHPPATTTIACALAQAGAPIPFVNETAELADIRWTEKVAA